MSPTSQPPPNTGLTLHAGGQWGKDTMASDIHELNAAHHPALKALLSRDPVANLFLLGILEEFGQPQHQAVAPYRFFGRVAKGAGGKNHITAALFIGGNGGLWVPAGSPEDMNAFLSGIPRLSKSPLPPLHAAVGPRDAVDALVRQLVPERPAVFRAQKLLAVSADDLGPFTNPILRLAKEEDLPGVLALAAGAVREWTQSDGLALENPRFEARVLRRIHGRRTYVLEVDGRLVFKVDIGSRSEFGAELEGLYTAPDDRGRGHAILSLGQICRHLLSSLPRLTLRVDEDSQLERIARKVGFLGQCSVRLARVP